MADATVFYTGPIVTREEALTRALTNFFTGMSCSRDHISLRNTKNGKCLACNNFTLTKWTACNADKLELHREKHRQGKLASTKKWKQSNRRRHCELNALSRNKHLEKTRERVRRYQKKNPGVVRAIGQNRRARLRAIEGTFKDKDIVRIRHMQKNKCAICKTKLLDLPKFIHIDHIVAITKNGTNWPSNLQLLCHVCNLKKWNHDPIEFMQSLGFLI